MSFFDELKRRNVFRVGAAYAVAAWVLLQMFDVVGEILELPAWGGKLILFGLLIGFFLVLFFAWAFEMTPEGVKREKDIDRSQSITRDTGHKLNRAILVLMAISIVYLLVDKFYLSERIGAPATDAASTESVQTSPPETAEDETVSDTRPSIAVLPFENRSHREEDEFFVEGVHDDLLTTLARIGSLKVISRTSVTKYRGTEKTIPEIAGELGVGTIMEGAVQRSGNTVRVNVQLIDASTDEHLWAEIFDRELTADNLFAIQSEISTEIAKALKATLTPEEQERLSGRPTENLAAYNAYLRGRQLMVRRTSTDIDLAATEFQRAVELDPQFALAWVGLSESAALQSQYSDLDPVESLELQSDASDRALAIDDQLGEAYLGRAGVLRYYERYEEAEEAYKKAIKLSPGYATAYHWYGSFLNIFPSRRAEAVELMEKALELDPLSSVIRGNLATAQIRMGRYGEAENQLDRLQELDPGFVSGYVTRATLASETGRIDEQVRWLNKAIAADPGRLNLYGLLLWAYLDLDYTEPFEDIRQRLIEVNDQHPQLGLLDMLENLYRGNYDGTLEAANWYYDQVGRPPFMQRIIGYINLTKGDYAAARRAFEAAEPRWLDPEQWDTLLVQFSYDGCQVGAVLRRTGDEELGVQLLQLTLDFLQNELSGYMDHADRNGVEACLLELGRPQEALAAIETRVAHGHVNQWWLYRVTPIYEPLWGNPEFEALMDGVEQDMARQRAELIREQETAL